MPATLHLTLRRRLPLFTGTPPQPVTIPFAAAAEHTALLLCDVWDDHWCRGAAERVNLMAPRINAVAEAARRQGVFVIHAPSDTLDFYTDHPARRRMQAFPVVEPAAPMELPDPPLPIDDSDGGCDTGETPWEKAWTRQHPAIAIHDEDGISDNGREVYSALRARAITLLLIGGVHTNMCVVGRSFGIKAMVRWGMPVALLRDLTDAMYNPAMPPHVSHDRGTELVIEHIETHWCPSLLSTDIAP